MNKQELIEKLMTKTKQPVSHADMERIVNGMMDEIKTAVAANDSVQLVGFGTFFTRDRAARTAHNPQTGEPVQIPAKRAPAFKPGRPFKDIVNQ